MFVFVSRYSVETQITAAPPPAPSVHPLKLSTLEFTHKSVENTAHCVWSCWDVSSQVCVCVCVFYWYFCQTLKCEIDIHTCFAKDARSPWAWRADTFKMIRSLPPVCFIPSTWTCSPGNPLKPDWTNRAKSTRGRPLTTTNHSGCRWENQHMRKDPQWRKQMSCFYNKHHIT